MEKLRIDTVSTNGRALPGGVMLWLKELSSNSQLNLESRMVDRPYRRAFIRLQDDAIPALDIPFLEAAIMRQQ